MNRVFRVKGGLYRLNISGEKPAMALLRSTAEADDRRIIHVDFMQVKMTEKITAMVPVVVVGEEELVKQGAILQAGLKRSK